MGACAYAKSLQSCLTLCDPVDASLPGFSVSENLEARILEWLAMPSSRGSSQPRELNPGLSRYRWILYRVNHQGSITHHKVMQFCYVI